MAATLDLARHGLIPPPARPPLPGGVAQTVGEALARLAREAPRREALVGRHARYTAAELDEAADRAARALADLGVEPGDRVAACLPNDAEIVVAFLGAQRLGALWVGVNRNLAPAEKRFLLEDSGARLLLADAETGAALQAPGAPPLPEGCRVLGANAEGSSWERVLAAAEARPPAVAIDPFAPAAIAYTSGTTGFPKGAVHSQHNLLLPGAVSAWRGDHAVDEPLGVVLPLTILNLMVLGPLAALQIGCPCVCMDRLDAVGVAGWVESEGVVSFAGVPALLHDLLTHPDVRPAQLAALRRPLVGGAECPESFRRLYRERFGRDVSVGYGMTEAPTAVTSAEARDMEPGLCGKALPQVEIRILGEDGAALGPGEVGEICVAPARRGPWADVYTPMLGYWNRPEATREALAGGVYHSGDLGCLDAEGTLFIRGRRNELILRGGANVYPAEVERVIQGDPRVAACAVLGRPDPRLGERVAAVVQLAPGAEADAEALRAACADQLARYKVPEFWFFVDALPRNAMNKVVKPRLRELVGGEPAA